MKTVGLTLGEKIFSVLLLRLLVESVPVPLQNGLGHRRVSHAGTHVRGLDDVNRYTKLSHFHAQTVREALQGMLGHCIQGVIWEG